MSDLDNTIQNINKLEDCTCDEGHDEEECPYDREIYDIETLCTCCPVCRDACADDI
ncbi:MAG: hypothetical protein H8D23_16660 [Candidatus Brocadiales bacterium]|nr:hypothetical protein [Candidatus Brocadiales bacterium]